MPEAFRLARAAERWYSAARSQWPAPHARLVRRRHSRRKNRNTCRIPQSRRGALHIYLQHQVESFFSRLLQPLFRSAVGMLAENAGVLQELAALDHGVEFRVGNKIITLPTGLGRAARPCGT